LPAGPWPGRAAGMGVFNLEAVASAPPRAGETADHKEVAIRLTPHVGGIVGLS